MKTWQFMRRQGMAILEQKSYITYKVITENDANLTFRQLCWDIAAVWPA
jgi:hypothetical protein